MDQISCVQMYAKGNETSKLIQRFILKYANVCIDLLPMALEKDSKVLSLRPKKDSTLRCDLIILAETKKWSLNQYAIEVLEEHVKKTKPKKK